MSQVARSQGELVFAAPGPGHWQADHTHWPRPCTRFYAEAQPEGFHAGFREAAARYGLLVDHVAARWVHGVMYTSPVPVAEQEIPARVAAAASAFERRLWREDLARWEQVDKPAAVQAHLALQAVNLAALSTEELVAHIEVCREHLQAMTAQHHRYNGAAFIPVGDFLVHAAEWTGLTHADLLALVAGTAPASGGDSQELSQLITALDRDPAARALLAADEQSGASLAELASLPEEIGAATRRYLDLVGYRPLDGFDVGEPYALEHPEVLLRAIRTRLQGDEDSSAALRHRKEVAQRVHQHVAPDHRERFAALLEEARLAHRLRDERGLYSDVWALGLMRRALLAAGARLVDAGRLKRADHLVEAGYAEVRGLLLAGDGPSGAELADRAAARRVRRSADAPDTLGDAPPPAPPLDALPEPAARAMRALLAVLGGVFGDSEATSDRGVVRGLAASPGTYEGRARVLEGPAALHRLRAGDVLVTASTSEAFNVALPLLGAIVTDRGGVLSHAGIVARECAIPAVVGTRDATTLIPDGARVRVDGAAGEVTVLG